MNKLTARQENFLANVVLSVVATVIAAMFVWGLMSWWSYQDRLQTRTFSKVLYHRTHTDAVVDAARNEWRSEEGGDGVNE